MLRTFSSVKRSKACALSTIYLQPKSEVSILNMTEESTAFGEVSKNVKRFKLDTSISKPLIGSMVTTPSSSAATASNSVYSDIEGLQNIQQLRGLRCARRRGRSRLIRRSSSEVNLVKKYAEAISILTPMFVEETQKQFTSTFSELVAKHEGKEPQNKYAAEINRHKNRPSPQKAKRRRFEIDQEELLEESEDEDITEVTEEEIETRRLKREVLAAIAAITAGVKQEELISNMYDLDKNK